MKLLKSKVIASAAILTLFGALSPFSFAASNNTSKANSTKVIEEAATRQKVNINSAQVEDLENLKFMSKTKAKKIVQYREQNGTFTSLDDLLKVKCRGIHQDWLDKVSPFLAI